MLNLDPLNSNDRLAGFLRRRLARWKTLFAKVRSVQPGEWRLLGEAAVLLALLPIFERLFSVPRLVRIFDVPRAARSASGPDRRRLTWLTDALLRRFSFRRRGRCLPRSLLLFRFLRRRGDEASRLCFGVAKVEGQLRGHAWVEIDGEPFAEASAPDASFHRTYAYPDHVPSR